jgi:hypothetical protein
MWSCLTTTFGSAAADEVAQASRIAEIQAGDQRRIRQSPSVFCAVASRTGF